jgi:GNAT superfamily N-acetyltransferase
MTEAQADEVAALCGEVFDCDYRSLMDLCPVRTHVLGYAEGRLVAHALWLDRPLRIAWGPWLNAAYVEGVATHPAYRERGYGVAVMRRLQEEIRDYDLAALSPAVEEWYLALGWERWQGPLFIEEECSVAPTPDECVLIYRTPKTPAIDLKSSLTAPWRPFELW